ncbi:glypican-5 isoform X1 [Microcaecilia unicolor]|uniref:Glypican-5-like isoform X1 n=1 Tax=Microcaecilia unicolor TaxID=1415580 RepID=A0A6P7Z9J5_9AMPH|nr:glypican-5-like isoform X1 [Microcaecilia unicolor]
MAGGRNCAACPSRLWWLPLCWLAVVTCTSVSASKSPSCHEVRSAFQSRQIGPLMLVPDVPTLDSDLQICQHRTPTCCTKKMEESYQTAVRRELIQTIQSLNFELKYMIVDHLTAFQETFETMISFAVNHTQALFDTTYQTMAKEAVEPVKELFMDLSLYILGADTTVESAVSRFFDSLFPLVYSRRINPGITHLSEEYAECLRLTRKEINPFGPFYKAMVAELSKSVWASRMLHRGLNMGIEVINTTEHITITKDCNRALVKMQYCPHCQGLTLIRSCVGYCLNVMRGCLAGVAELDPYWREYIATMEHLTNEMVGSHEVELALLRVRYVTNEAILYAQLNGPQLSATVDKVCGQLDKRVIKFSQDSMMQTEGASETYHLPESRTTALNSKRSFLPLKASKNKKPRSLKKISRDFVNNMKRSRTFYASLAERLCNAVVRDSSTCWNGEDVVESYTNRIVSNGLKAQVNNPEMKVKGPDPLINNMIDTLHHFNQMDTEKKRTKSERFVLREDGSGDGKYEEIDSSGDCDDEDGCQGSGDKIQQTEKKAYEDLNVAKIPLITTATAKSPRRDKTAGNTSNQVSTASVFIITLLTFLCQYLS